MKLKPSILEKKINFYMAPTSNRNLKFDAHLENLQWDCEITSPLPMAPLLTQSLYLIQYICSVVRSYRIQNITEPTFEVFVVSKVRDDDKNCWPVDKNGPTQIVKPRYVITFFLVFVCIDLSVPRKIAWKCNLKMYQQMLFQLRPQGFSHLLRLNTYI